MPHVDHLADVGDNHMEIDNNLFPKTHLSKLHLRLEQYSNMEEPANIILTPELPLVHETLLRTAQTSSSQTKPPNFTRSTHDPSNMSPMLNRSFKSHSNKKKKKSRLVLPVRDLARFLGDFPDHRALSDFLLPGTLVLRVLRQRL